MQRLGGDFIKFALIGEDRVALLVADVTGHGVPAALMVNRINTRVEALMKESLPPLAASRELSAFVADVFAGTGILMSAIWAEFRAHGREISWVGFGHPPALRVTPEGIVEDLPSMTHLLGIHDPMPVPVELSCHLAPGDLVIFYTDGLIEAPNEVNPFRLAELKACLAAIMAAHGGVLGAEAVIEEIARHLKDCRSEEALDDLLVVAVEIAG
jgi:serine phosphatase RsbU (regulator of sigma subunit)